MIISIGSEKAFDKVYHDFMIKVLEKLETDRTFLKTMKIMCDKPTADMVVDGKTK